jgi:hypothetical protein
MDSSASGGTIAPREDDTRAVVALPEFTEHFQDEARLEGRLVAGQDGDNVCAWIEADVAGGAKRWAIRWPAGFSALLAPLELMNRGGNVVAREGDTLVLTGGAFPDDDLTECRISEEVWHAHVVRVARRE